MIFGSRETKEPFFQDYPAAIRLQVKIEFLRYALSLLREVFELNNKMAEMYFSMKQEQAEMLFSGGRR